MNIIQEKIKELDRSIKDLKKEKRGLREQLAELEYVIKQKSKKQAGYIYENIRRSK